MSLPPVLGVTINSTQNIYGMCQGAQQFGFRRYEDAPDNFCGGSVDSGTLVDGFLLRPGVPFYFIWCRDWSYGLTREAGNYSTITSLGLSRVPDGETLENVIDGDEGTTKTIKSYCENPPPAPAIGITTTVAENSWRPLTVTSTRCCILTFTPTHNYTNDIYLQSTDDHNRYVRLITDAAGTPTNPNTNTNNTVPTGSASSSNSSSSSSSSSSASTGTSSPTFSTAQGSNSSSSSSSSSSTGSGSTGTASTSSPPSPTGKPVPSGAASASITNPTQALVIAFVIIVCAVFAQ